MSENPYAALGGEVIEPAPERTSVLAILSLVIAIISIIPLFCILPGSGALAVIFGGAALMFIHRERGRLSGTGLAATGIVLGLLITVTQIAVIVVANKAMGLVKQTMAGPIEAGLTAMQNQDLLGARKMFTPAADAQISDEMLTTFIQDYQAKYGKFTGFPNSMLDGIQTFAEIAPAMASIQGRNDAMPLPGHFEKSNAAVIVIFDQASMQRGQSGSTLPVRNLGIVDPQGKGVWLVDLAQTPPTWGPGGRGNSSGGVRIRTPGVNIEVNGDTETSPLPPPPTKPASEEKPTDPPEPEKPDQPS